MYKLIIFGGTTEGRQLHDFAVRHSIPALTCVATEYGAGQLTGGEVRHGRLCESGMSELMAKTKPALVIDATHPYAVEVTHNIKIACNQNGVNCLRVLRENSNLGSAGSLDELIEQLELSQGDVFITLGVKEAGALTALTGFAERLWLRILPSIEGLSECLALGYPAKRIICMQGPFSKELNLAMFRDSGAKILVTKESGGTGGFSEKLEAARELGMEILILRRPHEPDGVPISTAIERIAAL